MESHQSHSAATVSGSSILSVFVFLCFLMLGCMPETHSILSLNYLATLKLSGMNKFQVSAFSAIFRMCVMSGWFLSHNNQSVAREKGSLPVHGYVF